jgi:hypothetical protein
MEPGRGVAVSTSVALLPDVGTVVTKSAIGLIDLNDRWGQPVTGPETPSRPAEFRRWFVIRQSVTSSL